MNGSSDIEEAVRRYAEVVGIDFGRGADELFAETVQLLEELMLLADEDLGRHGMVVELRPRT